MAATYILRGTASYNAGIGNGNKQFVAGSAEGAVIKSGGSQVIFGGGISNSATVSSGGVQVIQSATLEQKNTLGIKYLSSINYTGRVSSGAVVWREYWDGTWETGYAKVNGSSLYYSGDFAGGIYGVPYNASAVYSGGKFTVNGKIKGGYDGLNVDLNIKNKSISGIAVRLST